MPGLNHPLTLSHCKTLKVGPGSDSDPGGGAGAGGCLYTVPVKTLAGDYNLDSTLPVPVSVHEEEDEKSLDEYVKAWKETKIKSGVSEKKLFLPFLVGAPKQVECRTCQYLICPGEEVVCSVRGCPCVFHLTCVKDKHPLFWKKFKCPQHSVWCILTVSQDELFVGSILSTGGLIRRTGFLLNKQLEIPATNTEEILCHLPLPYIEEEFKIDPSWTDLTESILEPPSYVHIRRNIYMIKRKRVGVMDSGCTDCISNQCSEDCVCRVQCISCSKACHCSEICTNRPFRKEKKIRLVKTEHCGWGAEAAVPINQGEFVIEYVGEVINDAICAQRLWEMKYKGVRNFYLCEIQKDFIIDATFKGNSSRFLNHSCQPNCKLEKWQVEGETRVGVFAAHSIKVGEPLTYDYRFVQFGPEVICRCGAPKCQGYLGTKKKMGKIEVVWGSKRKRTPIVSCIHGTNIPASSLCK